MADGTPTLSAAAQALAHAMGTAIYQAVRQAVVLTMKSTFLDQSHWSRRDGSGTSGSGTGGSARRFTHGGGAQNSPYNLARPMGSVISWLRWGTLHWMLILQNYMQTVSMSELTLNSDCRVRSGWPSQCSSR